MNVFGFTGQATIDYFINGAQLEFAPRRVSVSIGTQHYEFPATVQSGPLSKITLDAMNSDLSWFAHRIAAGGGGLNSLRAFRMISRQTKVRYLEASRPNPDIEGLHDGSKTGVRFL